MYLEIVTMFVAISNTFLFLVVSSSFKYLLTRMGMKTREQQMWFVILSEHLLLFLLLFLKGYIDDFPIKLKKL